LSDVCFTPKATDNHLGTAGREGPKAGFVEVTTRRFPPPRTIDEHAVTLHEKAAGKVASKRDQMKRPFEKTCDMVKMIDHRGRSQSDKKMLSLDMGLPRLDSMAKPELAAFCDG
jgi:hypothetical protein